MQRPELMETYSTIEMLNRMDNAYKQSNSKDKSWMYDVYCNGEYELSDEESLIKLKQKFKYIKKLKRKYVKVDSIDSNVEYVKTYYTFKKCGFPTKFDNTIKKVLIKPSYNEEEDCEGWFYYEGCRIKYKHLDEDTKEKYCCIDHFKWLIKNKNVNSFEDMLKEIPFITLSIKLNTDKELYLKYWKEAEIEKNYHSF